MAEHTIEELTARAAAFQGDPRLTEALVLVRDLAAALPAPVEHAHSPKDWNPQVAPEGATDWEKQAAVRHWRNAIIQLADTRARIDRVRDALLDVDPAAPGAEHVHDTTLNNAAQHLAEATYQVAAYTAVVNGTIHRQAIDRQRIAPHRDALQRLQDWLDVHAAAQQGQGAEPPAIYDVQLADLAALLDALAGGPRPAQHPAGTDPEVAF